MTVSALDCTGCGSCANVCPGKKGEKALAMENIEANAGMSRNTSTMAVDSAGQSRSYRLNSKRQLLREASSNSRCLSSPALVQVVVRHLTQN